MADLSQLDLQNLPPEQAAALIRAHQQELAQQQHHALLGMLGTVPELQEAGKAEYGQAGKERGTTQELGTQVLKQTLGEREANARLLELQNQGANMRGMLAVAMGNLGVSKQQADEAARRNRAEERIREIMAMPPVPPKTLEELRASKQTLLELDDIDKRFPSLSWATKLARPHVESGLKATQEVVRGYRAMGGIVPPDVLDATSQAAPEAAPAPPAGQAVPPPAGRPAYTIMGPSAKNPGKVTVQRSDGQKSDVSPEAARKLTGQ